MPYASRRRGRPPPGAGRRSPPGGCRIRPFCGAGSGDGDAGFFLDAFLRQQVGVDALIRVATEVISLDHALFNKCLDTVIGFAQANAHGGGQLALGVLGVLREELE